MSLLSLSLPLPNPRLIAGTCLQRLGTGAVLPLCWRAPLPPGCEEEGPGHVRWGGGQGFPGCVQKPSDAGGGPVSVWETFFRVVKIPLRHLSDTSPSPRRSQQSRSSVPPLRGAKLCPPGADGWQKDVDQQLCPGLTLSPLLLQIEFVTGTKKGTTTNATATTTTTASTAVAGRRRIARLQPHHRWSKGFPALLGASRPRGEVGIPMGVGASAPPCHAFI